MFYQLEYEVFNLETANQRFILVFIEFILNNFHHYSVFSSCGSIAKLMILTAQEMNFFSIVIIFLLLFWVLIIYESLNHFRRMFL